MSEEVKGINPIVVFIKNLVLEFILTLILLIVLAVTLSVSSLSESTINPSIIFITAFSILIRKFLFRKKNW